MSGGRMDLAKFTFGIGDRFGRQGKAQLEAFRRAKAEGLDIAPVWNKSNREHGIIGTIPGDVRREADEAVRALGWAGPYHVDADHVSLGNVDRFIEASDYFTIDVADFAGVAAPEGEVRAFVDRNRSLAGAIEIPGIAAPLDVSAEALGASAGKYLLAVREAARIHRHIEASKGAGRFIAEISMDETDAPQTPIDLLVILAAVAGEGIPVQAIAPRFPGRFNKGVDYAGDPARFAADFERDLAVVAFAIQTFGLPPTLKLSVHSGSDKFSIYEPIRRAIARAGAGVHVKTAGTTWLEEIAGLAAAGGDGLALAKEVYREAHERIDELCAPYATVIEIDPLRLPDPRRVDGWSAGGFASALRHDRSCPAYNPHLRQLMHVAYKVAAEMGVSFLDALARHEDAIAPHVTENILDRHMRPIFGAPAGG
ncbi:MAG: hypothetical protein JXP34_10880 [Planctomycetes bacterium]|nr:hypothetical protein [Planctomycetota bacterium]